jgi:hypothetical protein
MEKMNYRTRNDGFPANNTHQKDSIHSAMVSGQKDGMNNRQPIHSASFSHDLACSEHRVPLNLIIDDH